MRESSVESMVCREAKAIGIHTLKLGGPNDRGKEDRLFLHQGVAVFMELKATGEKPSPLQEKRMRQRQEMGFQSAWFDAPGPALQWLRKVFNL